MTKVVVIGKDARSECIAEAIERGGGVVYAMSDFAHPGLMRRAHLFRQGRTDSVEAVVEFTREVRPDLVVIGPEDPLAAGVVDEIRRRLGTPCVGPTKALTQVEASKSFTRNLLAKHHIAGQVEHRTFTSLDGVSAYLGRLGAFVVKPDGLTGGKGVKVYGDQLHSVDDGVAYAASLLEKAPVVLEEKLEGEEFSLQSFCDGDTVVDLLPVQDHKRAYEGDRGPNTGGMGSYSGADHRLPFLDQSDLAAASAINAAVARALREETGEPYRGVLYGGFMCTADGVRLIEYNARFGDPEAMNVLPLLKTNFLAVCTAIAEGHLGRLRLEFEAKASVCKYIVPQGYPSDPVRNRAIDLTKVARHDSLRTYFAAVNQVDGEIVMTGSRAVALVGIADTISAAGEIAELAATAVDGPVEHRRDIGTDALVQRRVDHLRALRAARPA